MNLYRLLRFFLPLQNPLGFGLADFLELGIAALFVFAILARDRTVRVLKSLAERTAWAMATLFALPILLRLALLATSPAPIPTTSDDFAYVLLGDTIAHFRLANPPHPMQRFFETVFVLQEPTYSSIYPPGQGIVLALGQLLFRNPWAGVLLSAGALCALTYRMLLAWVEPIWALAGGLYMAMHFGPLNQWTNTFWGGALPAIAGCLVFGAIPRLWQSPSVREAALLGLGCAIQILTRPFESVLLAIAIAPPLIVLFRREPRRIAAVAILAVSPAFALTLFHNKAVTGSWTTLPYMLSRYQYGIPANFTFQPNAQPHRTLNREQQVDYQAQSDVHGYGPETLATYFVRLAGRIRFYSFFLVPPLLLALPFFLPDLRRRRFQWVAASVAVFALGTNIYPYFYPQYIAAITCLLILMAVLALRRLNGDAARILILFCVFRFAFWYGVHLFGNDTLFGALESYESWDFVNFGDVEGRRAFDHRLAESPGRQLVFVRLGPRHLLREWIHNDAEIDNARVVWALDLGPDEDAKLLAYYPNRTAWLVEPDAVPPRLEPWPATGAERIRP
jgi:hypothetical protein